MVHLRTCSVIAAALAFSTSALADPGDPIAIRWWGGGHVTIETLDDVVISIDPVHENASAMIRADLVLLSHGPAAAPGVTTHPPGSVVSVVDETGAHAPLVFDPDRLGGAERAITIRAVPAERDEILGDERGRTGLFVIEVDGVRILHAGALRQSALRREQIQAIGGGAEIVLLPTGPHGLDALAAARILRQLGPRVVIPIGTRMDGPDDHPLDGALISRFLPSHFATEHRRSNTLAVYELPPTVAVQPAIVTLAPKAPRMPDALQTLLVTKEAAARQGAAAFAHADAAAMNRGGDDDPAPRWHAEVVRARELAWMSAIMQRVDTWMPVIDRIPAAGDPPRHPAWTGAEEAMQIDRVQAFTRRYADRLARLDLDTRPDGVPEDAGTLRELLTALGAAYEEHGRLAAAKLAKP